MKNLKKVLCLALVLVLALGLFATASATDYKDQDSIKYTEAVDVLSGIGILQGLPDGSFNPKGDVTRAQAAKIIAYLMLGQPTADALKATSAPFPDVDVTHWAAGYVQYCSNQGILAGYTDGTFKPNANVKTIELAKMLLAALGYNANKDLEGAQWRANITKYAARAELFKSNYAANPEAPANREEAALYAFNAMFAPKVVWSALLGDYVTSNIFGAGTSTSIPTFADDYGLSEDKGAVTYDTLDGFVVNTTTNVDADASDLGRNVRVWNQYGKAVAGPYDADVVLATKYNYAGATNLWTVRGPGKDYVAPENSAKYLTYFVDGVQVGSLAGVAAGDRVVLVDAVNEKGEDIPDGKVDTYIVTTFTAGTVAKVNTNKAGQITGINLGNALDGGATAVPSVTQPGALEGVKDLKAGDVVYYNFNKATNTYYFCKAETVEGQKTAQNKHDQVITFAGARYGVSDLLAKPNYILNSSEEIINQGANTGMTFNTDSVIYLDEAGNVLAFSQKAELVPLTYAILVDAAAGVNGSALSAQGYYEAKLVFTDGTSKIVNLAGIKGYGGAKEPALSTAFNKYDPLTKTDPDGLANKWYSYTVDEKGAYTLAAVTSVDKFAATVTTGKVDFNANGNTYFANAKTAFIVATKNAFGQTVYTLYTGYAALPSSSANAVDTLTIMGLGNVAAYVFIDATGDANYAKAAPVYEYAFVTGLGFTTYASRLDAEYHAYVAIIKGELAQMNVLAKDNTSNDVVNAAGIGLYMVQYDGKGYVAAVDDTTTGDIVNAAATEKKLAIVSEDLLTLGGEGFACNAKTVAYIYNSITGELEVGTIADVGAVLDDITWTSIKRASGDNTKIVPFQTALEVYVIVG